MPNGYWMFKVNNMEGTNGTEGPIFTLWARPSMAWLCLSQPAGFACPSLLFPFRSSLLTFYRSNQFPVDLWFSRPAAERGCSIICQSYCSHYRVHVLGAKRLCFYGAEGDLNVKKELFCCRPGSKYNKI